MLVSKATFSGAESLAITLKDLKRAVIVGETTGGGAHLTRQFKVTEHFSVWVPFGRGVSPITQTDWEGVGVTPDVSVPAADALRTAYRAALRRIAASTTNVAQKQTVERLLAAPSKK